MLPAILQLTTMAVLASMLPQQQILTMNHVFLALIFLPVYEVLWILYCRFLHPLSDIPGPFFASFSRLWLAFSVIGGRAEYTQRELHKRYGPLVRIAPNEVAVSDPSAVKVIYNIKSGFTKTDFYPPQAPKISPHGDRFSQLDELKHAQRRKYVNSIYSMSSILESEKYIDACTDVFLEKMNKFGDKNETIDFGEWTQWYVEEHDT